MFKFLKELRESVREGVAEGRAEMAEEAAADAAETSGVNATEAEAHVAALPDAERFAAALNAPYRDVFLSVMRHHPEDRPAVALQTFALPEDQKASYANLLKRDFEARDADSLRAAVALFWRELDGGTHPETGEPASTAYAAIHRAADGRDDGFNPKQLAVVSDFEARWGGALDAGPRGGDAFRLAVLSHLIGGAAGLGWIDHAEALDLAAPVSACARGVYGPGGWPAWADGFLAGERAWGGTNALGRKFLAGSVKRLLTHDASPWRRLPFLTSA